MHPLIRPLPRLPLTENEFYALGHPSMLTKLTAVWTATLRTDWAAPLFTRPSNPTRQLCPSDPASAQHAKSCNTKPAKG
ncbi:hypothetical protein SAMN04488238_102112 [Roseicitreum antarcticum]|uniref:Uncharacterized protein n=1 Tax=Roseicitreum antarcticum TaxID=564137 RepID=A0A1H2TPP6_9RHOB|nr:hypothetical protein SAMN04488238_102112 [Roseicitreum antarcticum]